MMRRTTRTTGITGTTGTIRTNARITITKRTTGTTRARRPVSNI